MHPNASTPSHVKSFKLFKSFCLQSAFSRLYTHNEREGTRPAPLQTINIDTMKTLKTSPLTRANAARLVSILCKPYKGGTLETYLESINHLVVGKQATTETHARRKVNGCYAKLKNPKTTYHLKVMDEKDGGFFLLRVEKLVFDLHYQNFTDLTNSPPF